MSNFHLTKDEQEILTAYEQGKLKPVKNVRAEIKRFQQYAQNTMNKTRNINIRLSEPDLYRIKVIAAEKGLPYQTFIGSVLHQYSSGKIKEISRETV